VLAVLVGQAEQAARALVALLDHPDPNVQRRAACLILDLIGVGCRPKLVAPIRCTAEIFRSKSDP
jgi:hypothetical protein